MSRNMRSYCYCSLSINIFVNLLCCMVCSASNHLYIGCYTHFSETSDYRNTSSISECLKYCKSQVPLFVALKDGSSCYCGNTTNTRVPSSNCNLTCADNNEICGGNNLYAVYTDIPPYQGCFDLFELHIFGDMIREGSFLSIDGCCDRCLSLNYKLCGVNDEPVRWAYCFCGDSFGSHVRFTDSECEFCPENYLKCRQKRPSSSIYSVGHLPSLNKSYSDVFHCRGGETFKNGTCNRTICKIGWKGTKCNQRDCRRYNGKCGDHKCEDINIGNQNISECVCKKGFQSISIYDDCKDLDECQSNLCNEPSETCINTIGSFMCICSPGYNYTYQSDCIVNCSKSLYICGNSNSCNKLSNYTCSLEIKDIQENCGRATVAILGVFLALSMCALITCAVVGIFCYRKKLKDTESRQDKLRETIPENGEKSNPRCSSKQYQEENKYEELRINDIYEN